MQEIQLKAWDEEKQIMHYNFQFIRGGTQENDWMIFSSNRQTYDKGKDEPCFTRRFKIMRGMGVKDKNNREIYEGDVVSIKGNYCGDDWFDKCYAYIKFQNAEFVAYYLFAKHEVVPQEFNWNEVEVIGNIYDILSIGDK